MKKLWKTCSTQEDVKKLLADRMCRNEKTSARIHSILQQDFSVEVVKENPKRRVLRLVFQDEKANLYLKLFAPAHFPFSLGHSLRRPVRINVMSTVGQEVSEEEGVVDGGVGV